MPIEVTNGADAFTRNFRFPDLVYWCALKYSGKGHRNTPCHAYRTHDLGGPAKSACGKNTVIKAKYGYFDQSDDYWIEERNSVKKLQIIEFVNEKSRYMAIFVDTPSNNAQSEPQ